MQLRQAKSLRVLDHHDRRLGYIDTDFDHGRGNEHLRLARSEAGHGCVFIRALHAAMDQVDPLSEFLSQVLEPRLGGSKVDLFGFVHQRADPVGALALLNCTADGVFNILDTSEGDGASVDWLAARRLFAQFRNVHIAEIGKNKRARDRRGGKHQHVDGLALLHERKALVDAEPMLFVDNRQGKVMEGNVLLKEGVRPDQKVDVAKCEAIEDLPAGWTAFPASEDRDADAGRFREWRNGREMLAGENFSRRHESSLPASLDDGGGGAQCHDGLAGANVSLQETQHSLRPREIGNDVVNRLLLRMRERIGQGLQNSCTQAALAGAATSRLPAHVCTYQGKSELAGEQLIIGKSRPCWMLRKNIVWLRWPMQLPQCHCKGGKPFACDPGFVLPFRQIR